MVIFKCPYCGTEYEMTRFGRGGWRPPPGGGPCTRAAGGHHNLIHRPAFWAVNRIFVQIVEFSPATGAIPSSGFVTDGSFVQFGCFSWVVARRLSIVDPGRDRLSRRGRCRGAGRRQEARARGSGEEEVEMDDSLDNDDTFIEEQEEEDADVTDIIGGDIENKEEG